MFYAGLLCWFAPAARPVSSAMFVEVELLGELFLALFVVQIMLLNNLFG